MSEQAPQSHKEYEYQPERDRAEVQETIPSTPELATSERTPDKTEQIPHLRDAAEQAALPVEQHPQVDENDAQPSNVHIGQQVRHLKFHHTLARIRKGLAPPDRALSQVIHQPIIDAASQVGEKTVARPWGILGGSIVAFVGSSAFLWAAKHYGFRYNYFLFFLLFIGGFALGCILEIIIRAVRPRQN